jgi:hypothetical protein
LEEVVVAAVDHGDVDRLVPEHPYRRQATEPGADDDHPVPARSVSGFRHRGSVTSARVA